MFVFFAFIGGAGILLFHGGFYPPVAVSVSILFLAAVFVFNLYRQSRVGPLMILLFVTFALPFIHVFPYIWFEYGVEFPVIMWGLAVNPYMTDKTIIELTAMIGAVGAAGFAVGASVHQIRKSKASSCLEIVRHPKEVKTFSMPFFLAWVAVAVILSWISSPSETVFTAGYTESSAKIDNLNFSSALLISYSFLAFALADSLNESSRIIGKIKRKIVFYSVLLIVIWFQLLRGDRESLSFVLAAGLMYYVWGKGFLAANKIETKRNYPMLYFLFILVFVAAYVVGIARHLLVGADSISDLIRVFDELVEVGDIRIDNLVSGTWSGVLLTPLSVAGDYVNGILPLKMGQTYLDLLSSVVPGFLADWIGYARPIDALHGPAWEMIYGLGGTHAVVVPFMDFRMTGVFMIVALWSFAFSRLEHYLINHLTASNLSLLGILATAIPHWLWYGEKNIINALIVWFLLSILYKVRLRKRVSTLHFSGHAQRFN